MRIIAADSGCSMLDESFRPINIMVSTCILTEEPYHEVLGKETRVVDYTLRDPNVVVEELRMCLRSPFLEQADCVHLDTSLGGLEIADLNDSFLDCRIMSSEGRVVLKLIANELRSIAMQIRERTGAKTYAIGGRSVPIRLAEMCTASEGFKEARRRCSQSGEEVLVGLPVNVELESGKDMLTARSVDQPKLETTSDLPPLDVESTKILNPLVRGFLAYRIRPSGRR